MCDSYKENIHWNYRLENVQWYLKTLDFQRKFKVNITSADFVSKMFTRIWHESFDGNFLIQYTDSIK